MGVSQIPASTATGGRNWVQLGTSTPTTGSTVSFTSLATYNFYRVVTERVVTSGNESFLIRLNNDTSSKYATTQFYSGTLSSGVPALSGSPTTALNCGYFSVQPIFSNIVIDNTSTLTTATGFCTSTGNVYTNLDGMWSGNAQINRIDVLIGAATFSGSNTGTITVYGSN